MGTSNSVSGFSAISAAALAVLSGGFGSMVFAQQPDPPDSEAYYAELRSFAEEVSPVNLEEFPHRRPIVVLPPAWAFGVLYGGYADQAGALEKVQRLVDEDFPIDAYWIDSSIWDITGRGPGGYMDFVGDRVAYPDLYSLWSAFSELDVRAGMWVWDRILKTDNEEVFDDFYQRRFFSDVTVMTGRWHNDGESLMGLIDYDNPKAAAYWQESMRPFFDKGLDFIKIDAGATTAYMKAAFEATQIHGQETSGRGFILSHFNGDPADTRALQYPAKWTGDVAVQWTQPSFPDRRNWALGGLEEQVRLVADPNSFIYQSVFYTCDTGGYSHGVPNDELFTRWSQFSAFLPLMEVFGANAIQESNTPYLFSDDAQQAYRKITHLRMELFPYRYSLAHHARLMGHPITRNDGTRLDQFMHGPNLLVAPVFTPDTQERPVYLGPGVWFDFWSDERYEHPWGTTFPIAAPLDTIPLFVPAGAIIPMRAYERAIVRGSNEPLFIHLWPEGKSEFLLVEDDGSSNDYQNGRFTITRLSFEDFGETQVLEVRPREGAWRGMPRERTFHIMLHKREVESAQAQHFVPRTGSTMQDVAVEHTTVRGLRLSRVIHRFDPAEGLRLLLQTSPRS